jgi:hypothetical protein
LVPANGGGEDFGGDMVVEAFFNYSYALLLLRYPCLWQSMLLIPAGNKCSGRLYYRYFATMPDSSFTLDTLGDVLISNYRIHRRD